MKNYKIAVAGTGYVGLSLGVLFAQHHQVVAVDIVQAKVDMINNKKSPIQDAFNSSGSKGIACSLNNLQKIADGEHLGGKASAEEDFATEEDDDFLS